MIPIQNYIPEVYVLFSKAVSGSREAFKELIAMGAPEWAAFSNAIRGDDTALQFLLRRGFPEFGIMANAIDDEPKAMEWLAAYPDPLLYHFVQASKKDENSIQWLKDRDYIAFVLMAKDIKKTMLVRIKEETFWYKIKF